MQEHYWKFINNDGSFIWTNPDPVHKLYFPLCNELGFMSAITPRLHGDIKSGQHSFLTPPVSINDINNTKSARNFWFYVDGYGPISVSGNSKQEQIENMARPDEADVTIEGGLLFHKLSRMHHRTALKLEVLSFVPTDHNLEVMMISVENCSNSPVSLVPTSPIPLYARSAENLRDHRHVTSLVNRTKISEKGLEVHPEILFDERGHKYNDKIYYVYGAEGDGSLPEGTLGDLNAFIGQHGDLEWPEYIVQNKSFPETQDSDGKETLAAIRFQPIVLLPGQIRRYILLMGIDCSYEQIQNSYIKLNTYEKIMTALEKNNAFWQNEANKVAFRSGVKDFDHWMKWVEIQPIFRKIYGNSFLPHHDYGKGGRGWRDLWQDLLSIILLRPEESKDHLINNYGGIRLDGTNATIIGSQPGEFIADRNNISRVWMDHGTWPFLTTLLYMHQSGDTEILFSKNTYFRDPQIKRASDRDLSWTESYGNKQRTLAGEIYEGSLLEHILVQHYTSFYNVGTHNIILLEGADWNDTLDMANNHGESVPFTALYGRNMVQLADVLETMKSTNGIETVELFSALDRLIQPGDYESITEKKARLDAYYQAIYYS
ncbi:MAG TPA: cellobiose phosphorylase, partial [Clostridiales bacterium UBA8960]|nr:cellobiose phosphorylase [Clostridiales bacterium UBA8960]